tara:strand:- start:1206 stop:1325 length:120 start_codon:yes stop_codon:yes gene_type:complete
MQHIQFTHVLKKQPKQIKIMIFNNKYSTGKLPAYFQQWW